MTGCKKTILIDVILYGRFLFQIDWEYCPAIAIETTDIENEVLCKRPSLKGQPYRLRFSDQKAARN